MGLAIGTSGADFRSRLRLKAQHVRDTVQRKIIAYGSTLQATLVANTPILTGQAKANWQAVIGQPGGGFIGLNGPTSDPKDLAHKLPQTVDFGSYAQQAQAVIKSYQIGDVLYIYNNLPYIERLNEGYSGQAPAGFVESSILTASAAAKGQS